VIKIGLDIEQQGFAPIKHIKMADNSTDLETRYQDYLKMNCLDESKMVPIQRVETRRAFMGGISSSLILFRDVIGSIEDEDEAIKAMENVETQCVDFWNATIMTKNKKTKLN